MDQVISENYGVSQRILLDIFLLYCRWQRALKLANKQNIKKSSIFPLSTDIDKWNMEIPFSFPWNRINKKLLSRQIPVTANSSA